MGKAAFALHCLTNRWTAPRRCPHCQGEDYTLVGSKHLIMEVLRCRQCLLEYRYPPDSPEGNRRFYDVNYSSGLTTRLPTSKELNALKETSFKGSAKDWTQKVKLVRRFCPGAFLFDFGASWGYAIYQFQKSGYRASGFEVSPGRAKYGRKQLGVTIYDDLSVSRRLAGAFDIVHSSHVLEHLPNLHGVFEMFSSLLKPGGHLIVFVPNCGCTEAQRNGLKWGAYSGEVHPLSFKKHFFTKNLPRYKFLDVRTFSSPYVFERKDNPAAWETTRNALGPELCVVARK